jgi:proline dehydrogenase
VEKLKDHVVRLAARRYLAGTELAQAVALAGRLGRPTSLGYWNETGEAPEAVARAYVSAFSVRGDTYPSVKLPALAGDQEALDAVVEAARTTKKLLHFDSLAEEYAGPTLRLAQALASDGVRVGVSLPATWSRSIADARQLADAGVRVRIVKGQWVGDAEPVQGFLALAETLAGRGCETAVATHDARLAREALRRLPGAELELLYGLPTAQPLRVAKELGTPVRVYVPYGHGYLPYALRQAGSKPRILWWLARDLVLGLGQSSF